VIFEGQGEIATGVCALLSGASKITKVSYSGARVERSERQARHSSHRWKCRSRLATLDF